MNRSFCSVVVGLLASLWLAGGARGEVIYYDNFQQFPSGTALAGTNYTPPIGTSASVLTNSNPGEGSTSVTASNILGSTVAFFGLGIVPYDTSYVISPTSGTSSNPVLTLTFLLWTPALTNSIDFGGVAISGFTTNPIVSTNGLNADTLILLNDGGQIYTFTNTPSLDTAVPIGSWSNLVGQLITNQLVLDYPAGTFSYSINSTVLTNLPIPSFFTNVNNQLLIEADEDVTSNGVASLGNSFALGSVQLITAALQTNQDIIFYVAADKGQFYEQLSTNTPSLSTTGYVFQALVQGSASNSLISGSDRIPSGTILALVPTNTSSESLSFEQEFATKGALDGIYSNGIYTLSITTTNQGSFNPSLVLPTDDYPTNAPQIINFAAAQMVDSITNFVLQWTSFVDATNNDFISVNLADTNGAIAFATPNLGETGQLAGAATSVVITGGTLQAGETYTGTVSFVKITDTDTNSIPGATGVTAYFKQTEFTLVTLPPPCAFALSLTNLTIGASGGSTNIPFTANGTNCAFTAVSNNGFISITSATNGVGSGTLSLTINANSNLTAQVGTVTVGGETLTVNQAAFVPCGFTLSSPADSFDATGGSSNVTVTANGTNCAWTAVSNDSFITITSATNGIGNGIVTFTVAANTNLSAQVGSLTIGGQTLTISEAAPGPCTLALSTQMINIGGSGGPTNVSFTTSGTNCTWTATSSYSFITVTSATNGVGNGSVSFTVAANTNAVAQVGTIDINGQILTIIEAGGMVGGGCSFTLDSTSASFSSTGGSTNVNVTASGTNCAWTAVSNASFITITSATNGTGNGTVSFMVNANSNLTTQVGTLTIAGQTYTVTEAGLPSVVDLAITIGNSPNPVPVGSNLTYTITVSNVGSNDAHDVVIADTLPTNETFLAVNPTLGVATESGGVVTNTIAVLPAGASNVLTIVVMPADLTVTLDTNLVTVSTSDNDTNTVNNTTVAVTVVGLAPGAEADLTILGSVTPSMVFAGTNFTYTFTVTNAGPNTASNVVVTDQLPADLTLLSSSASSGTATNSGSLVTADLGDLSSGTVAQVSITVNPTNSGIVTNTAAVSAATVSLNATGSTVTVITPVFSPDDFIVTKLTATKKLTLTPKHASAKATITVVIEYVGLPKVTIPVDALSNLVTVAISSTTCTPPATEVVLPKKPVTLAHKKSLTVHLTTEYSCADTYSYVATVNHSALDGSPTEVLPTDVCPRPPNPAIGDKGCGDKNPATKQLGAPVTTTVIMKQ